MTAHASERVADDVCDRAVGKVDLRPQRVFDNDEAHPYFFTMPDCPEISTMSPTSTRSENTMPSPVTTSWTRPWEPKPIASPMT